MKSSPTKGGDKVEVFFIFLGVAIYWFVVFSLDGLLKRFSDNKVKIALANRDKAQAELELAKLEPTKIHH